MIVRHLLALLAWRRPYVVQMAISSVACSFLHRLLACLLIVMNIIEVHRELCYRSELDIPGPVTYLQQVYIETCLHRR